MKASVAMCTYNGDKYIEEQLLSIAKQTILPNEVVICDDASIDNTIEIINSFKKRYNLNIVIYKNTERIGVIKNFEQAINKCTQDIILLCDQEDIWFENKVEKTLNYFKENPGYDAVFHNLVLFKNNALKNTTSWEAVYFDEKFRKPNLLFEHLMLYNNVVTGAALAIRKPKDKIFIETLRTSDKSFSVRPYFLHDYLLAIRYASTGSLGIINESLAYYRIHNEQFVGLSRKKPAPLSPHYFYNNESNFIKLFYIKKRIETLKPYKGLRTEISQTLLRLNKEKKEIKKEINFFKRKYALAKHHASLFYQKAKFINKRIINKGLRGK